MTEQRKQRAPYFFIVFFISVILLAEHSARASNAKENIGKHSRSNATRFSSSVENGSGVKNEEKSNLENPSIITLEEENVNGNEDGDEDGDEKEKEKEKENENENENENEDADDEEEEYEGEDEAGDEYAEELRAAAESHEAMSRHDKQNENQSKSYPAAYGGINPSGSSKILNLDATATAKKDFDSKEKSVEETSDENESSNETIGDGVEQEDEEVTELLKYKSTNHFRVGDDTVKRKRVPTVKKELSTQTEIKALNKSMTRIEKRFSTKEMLDELNKQFIRSTGNTEKTPSDEPVPVPDQSPVENEEVSGEVEADVEAAAEAEAEDEAEAEAEADDYMDKKKPSSASDKLKTESKSRNLDSEDTEWPRKLDKRQEAVLRDLETYLRAEYAAEQEQQQKLEELGAQEGALAESLLELLVKLAENPRRWERVHRLLMDVEGGLELSRQALEARKRAFNLTSMASTTTTTSPVPTTTTTTKRQRKKPKKKKKKKKKKQRHHRFSTTTTTVPTTVPLLTTTEAPWLTTPMQWRLVAERLFGPPWPQDLQDDPGLPKVRFTVPSNSRTPPSASREFVDQLSEAKQREEHKALNSERQALMLESSREYTQPRHLHYGKVNTHQGVASHSIPNRDNSRVRDYDPPEIRYGAFDYPQRSRGPGSLGTEDEFYPVQSYAQNREYRPPGREYAASKSWHDSQYKYGIPSWKSGDTSVKWSWPQLEETKANNWQRESGYWPTRVHAENDAKVWRNSPENWEKDSSWGTSSSPWSPQDNVREAALTPPWQSQGKNRHDVSNSNLSRVTLTDPNKMTKVKGAWNDQGKEHGWPFKLKEHKDQKIEELQNDSKYKSSNKPKTKPQNSWSNEMNTNPKIWPPKTAMSPKIQSVGAWVMPVDQSTWKPYNLKNVETAVEGAESNRHRWNVAVDTNPRTWPPKIGEEHWNKFGKTGSGVAWPKWKQFAYHRVTAMPMLSNGGPGNSLGEGSRARNNAYIAVSAVSPKYNGNQWRKNDIEETPVVGASGGRNANGGAGGADLPPGLLQDPEHPVSQLRANAQEQAVYTWKKKDSGNFKNGPSLNGINGTDPLEEQLETLRRGATWSHNENRDNIKKQLNVINDASETLASRFTSSNSSASIIAEAEKINNVHDNNNNNNKIHNKNGETIDQNKN